MRNNNLEMDGGQKKEPTAITGDRTVLIAEVPIKHQNHVPSFASKHVVRTTYSRRVYFH
jgi:hypothetical protein